MNNSLLSKLAVASLIFCAAGAIAQVSVKTPGQEVRIGKGGGVNVRAEGGTAVATEGNTANVTIGGIDANANVQGVTIINGRVSIDGKEIPANVTRYKSPRTGTVYLIQRKGDSVNVTTDDGVRK